MTTTLSPKALTEEIDFFRNCCGWSDKRIERYLQLAEGTIAQRRRREVKRAQVKAAQSAIEQDVRREMSRLPVGTPEAA